MPISFEFHGTATPTDCLDGSNFFNRSMASCLTISTSSSRSRRNAMVEHDHNMLLLRAVTSVLQSPISPSSEMMGMLSFRAFSALLLFDAGSASTR